LTSVGAAAVSAARSAATTSGVMTRYVKPAFVSFWRSAVPNASTSCTPGRACSVWSTPVASSASRAAGYGRFTRTSEIFSPVGPGSGIELTVSLALSVAPERRQAWTVRVWPPAATPSASSVAPNDAEPATRLPVRLSKTPTSQSPLAADNDARTSPFALAVTVRWTTPAPVTGFEMQSRRCAPALATVVSTRSAAATAGAAARMRCAQSATTRRRFIEVPNEIERANLRAGTPPPAGVAAQVPRPPGAESRTVVGPR
jgi:hypothetical protein